ncbi:aspartyl/asparaginyl beta-hydroxylase-like isoform 3-T3 [Cochliomyia hominivorax]
MSGDVQPRKRKDKKKKRESLDARKSEGEIIFSRKSSLQDDEASHGVHITKMGSDDVHLHVHEEHGTGGHWCAKIIFFSLMAILLGLVCLIILENRGISDVDTPLSESRFSNYFDGWVDENRDEHDDHHDSHGSLEHDDHDEDDEHDHDDEPFEEEADHSEGDEDAEEEEEQDENVTPEEEDDEQDNATAENVTAEDEEDEDDEDNVTAEEDIDENATAEDADEENVTAENEDDNVTEEATIEQNDEDEDDQDENNTNEEDNVTQEASKPESQGVQDDDDEPFDEEDDDGNFDSLEKIVDNDAAELELLKEKARQQAAADSQQNAASAENDLEDEAENAPSWASSQIKPKTGGGPQSLEDEEFDLFEQELRRANDEMMREHYDVALKSFDQLIKKYSNHPRAYLGKAQTLDFYAEQRKSNRLLMEAIEMYKTYLKFNVIESQLQEYRSAAERCVERLRFLGQYQQSIPIHHQLIEKFPQDPSVRNQLVITYLMLNRLLDAKKELQEILQLWPQDGLALVHYGFVLKQLDHDYHNASIYLQQGIATNEKGTQDGRFYFQLGESLQRLGKRNEALEVFRKGAELKIFPSVYQRSLYNEPHLKAQPFWSLQETSYEKFFQKLQDNWMGIKAEGLNILSKTGYFMDEAENLKNKGDWKQFELFARGQQRYDNCLKAPITCSLIAQFPAARDCRRGQVKFSVMHPGTHVWPHCGPTNCRLRAHLGLVVPKGTRIRVAEEERSWQEGKFLIFDDSFEHEVWHEGQGLRLVLIIDIWHPDLNEKQRRTLSTI